MSPAELAACPFCGGEASLSIYETESLWSHNIVTYTQVGCGACDIHFASEPGFEVEAPEQWNTRTTGNDAAMREALEKARNTLAGLGYPKLAANICDGALDSRRDG